MRRLFLVPGGALVGWLGLGCAAPTPLSAPVPIAPHAPNEPTAPSAPAGPHWAFVPPVRTPTLGGNPIDALVRARLRDAGLELAPSADRTPLRRRVTLDLTGLPPTPAEVDAFLADHDGDEDAAYQRVIDRLLASPHYGEAMALPWLDAARYADSNGFQQDGDTWQWVWRDWLVQKLNCDLPFDQLSTRMLAGDLLPDASDDDRLGTAFLRNHLLNGEGGAIPEENRFVMLFDRVDTTCTTWLGLTVACAQCHDHKYDPITQREYYALLDAFGRVPENGLAGGGPGRFRIAEPALDAYRAEYDRFRRSSLTLRDQALATSGLLVPTLGGPPVYPYLAARVADEASDAGGRLAAAFRRVVARRPAADEERLLAAMYERQLAAYADDPAAAAALLAVGEAVTPCALSPVEHAALAAACLGILKLEQAQCRD